MREQVERALKIREEVEKLQKELRNITSNPQVLYFLFDTHPQAISINWRVLERGLMFGMY